MRPTLDIIKVGGGSTTPNSEGVTLAPKGVTEEVRNPTPELTTSRPRFTGSVSGSVSTSTQKSLLHLIPLTKVEGAKAAEDEAVDLEDTNYEEEEEPAPETTLAPSINVRPKAGNRNRSKSRFNGRLAHLFPKRRKNRPFLNRNRSTEKPEGVRGLATTAATTPDRTSPEEDGDEEHRWADFIDQEKRFEKGTMKSKTTFE